MRRYEKFLSEYQFYQERQNIEEMRIDDIDMKKLYRIKQETKKPITILVKEAVREYIKHDRLI